MTLDDRTPVIIGVGQVLQRIDEGEGLEPVVLLADAFRAAEADAGGQRSIAAAADSIRVVQILSWRYRDPARLVASRLGAEPGHTVYTGSGGQLPQVLVGRAALDIAAGRADVVLVGGVETWRPHPRQDGGRPSELDPSARRRRTAPPADGSGWEPVEPDPTPERAVAEGYDGPATVETWTVMFDRDGAPETGITTCLTPHGDRAWATTTDPDLLETMTSDDLAGSAVAIAAGRLEL